MPGFFLQVPGGPVGYEAYMPQVMPPLCQESTILWGRQWAYQQRSPDNLPQWDYSLISTGAWWPAVGSGAVGDSSFFGGDSPGFHAGSFDAWHYGLGGSQTRKLIRGVCKNQAGDILTGAVVQGFRTSDDWYIGQTETNDKGEYELGCPQTPTDQHYLVAYYASGNLAGTTVNTILPKWRDE